MYYFLYFESIAKLRLKLFAKRGKFQFEAKQIRLLAKASRNILKRKKNRFNFKHRFYSRNIFAKLRLNCANYYKVTQKYFDERQHGILPTVFRWLEFYESRYTLLYVRKKQASFPIPLKLISQRVIIILLKILNRVSDSLNITYGSENQLHF